MKSIKSKKSKKNQIGNRKAGSRINDSQSLIPHPPPLESYNVVHSAKVRFVVASAFSGNITWQNLLDLILVATTATALSDLFYAVRIRYLEVWSVPVLGTAVSVTVQFTGATTGFVGNQVAHTDMSMGIEPAHLRVGPGKKTLASMFQLSSNNVAFALEVPAGTVIDLALVYKGDVLGAAVSAQNVGVTLTAGATYWRGLDGLALATTKFIVPTGVVQA